jgi:hypothetical protein
MGVRIGDKKDPSVDCSFCFFSKSVLIKEILQRYLSKVRYFVTSLQFPRIIHLFQSLPNITSSNHFHRPPRPGCSKEPDATGRRKREGDRAPPLASFLPPLRKGARGDWEAGIQRVHVPRTYRDTPHRQGNR